jgi:hypothetical protein
MFYHFDRTQMAIGAVSIPGLAISRQVLPRPKLCPVSLPARGGRLVSFLFDRFYRRAKCLLVTHALEALRRRCP